MSEFDDLRRLARERAGDRCEYCLMPRALQATPYHLEHVIARQHRGATIESNVAWACSHCNLHKGPNVGGIDPDTQRLVPLFNPRVDRWQDHFTFVGPRVVAKTAVGRATVVVLALNDPDYVELRESLIAEGRFPPPDVH